jgi:hypothetical protein
VKIKLLSILIFFCLISFSQDLRIQGKVTFEKSNSDKLAEVIVSKQDSLLNSTVLEEDGFFVFSHLSPGNYTIEVKQWGKIVYAKNWDVKEDIDLGEIKVSLEKEIQQITVTGNKKLIERKVDRMVFNVENSVFSSGETALDILKKTPQIRLKEESLVLIGKSSMKVMINNRMISLSGKELITYLESVSSDDIKNVEIISNPPAKYEAEGNSGLININLKQAFKNTWSLSIRQQLKQASYSSYGNGLSFNINRNKIIFSSSVNYDKRKVKNINHINYFYPDENWNILDKNLKDGNSYSGRVSIDYLISKNNTVGFIYDYDYVQSTPKEQEKSFTKISNRSDYNHIYSLSTITDKYNYHSANLHDIYKIDSTKGKQITFDLDYFYNKSPKENYSQTNYSLDGNLRNYYAFENIGEQEVNNFSLTIDMQHPLSWMEMNYGAKISFNKTKNNIFYYDVTTGNPVLNLENTDKFHYKENDQSFYFTVNKKIKEKWEFKLGLRTEFTRTEGKSFTLYQTDRKKYVKLFPTAYLLYTLKDGATISVNYGRRIQRPRFYSLNPFRFYLNPYSYLTGNPDLKPTYSHNIEMSYVCNDFAHTLYYSKTEGDYEQVTILNNDNRIQINKPLNALNSEILGYKTSYSFFVYKRWESVNECTISYAEYKSPLSFISNRRNIGWTLYFSTDNTFYFNKNKTIAFAVDWWYNSKGPDQMDKGTSYNSLDFALKLFFINKNLQVSLRGCDVTGSNRAKWTSFTHNIKQTYKNYGDGSQYFLLSMVYKLGNKKLKELKRQTGNQEEKERIH